MQIRHLILLSFLGASFSGQVIAAEATPASEEKPAAMHKKTHTHKKDCVEKNGKPCHLHKDSKSSAKQGATTPTVAPEKPTASSVPAAPAAAAAAAAAPVAAAAAGKPASKADAVLSDADGRALAQKSGCFVCHAIDKKSVGPAWRDVAAKYRGDAGAEAKLVAKVSKGGSGAWGSTPMPANSPRVKDADIRALVKFTLSLK
jgi:cytochrome c